MAWMTEDDFSFDDQELQFWNPETGDQLVGTVKNVKKGTYEKYFLVVEDENGDVWATTQCARLHYQIMKMKIAEGDYVCIEYNGQRSEDNAHDYKLMVDRE
ncbi:hypothetical protein [Anaerotignum sp.]